MKIEIEALATVKNQKKEKSDDFWGGIVSEIELLPSVPEEVFDGIETFSHLEILFHFDRVKKDQIVFSGHPRGNHAWPKVGIFAQRKKDRPNRIGLTTVELIERKGKSIFVKNFDAIHGTPIIDIKPVMKEFSAPQTIKQPQWATELMSDYWKEVKNP